MPGGFGLEEVADLVGALGFFFEPVAGGLGVDEDGAFHMLGGAALDFGALGFVGGGVDGAEVGVGGHRGQDVGTRAGEQIHDAAGEVADSEDFAEQDGGVGLAVGGEGDGGVPAGDGG